MRSSYVTALLVAILLASVGIAAAPAAGSLAGSFYRGSALPRDSKGQQRVSDATAAAAYQIYVRVLPDGTWIGPVLTDTYGRFAFTSLAAGTYQLRAYDEHVRVWDQVVTVPSVIPPIVIRDVTVAYYPKTTDQGAVEEALQRLGYPFEEREPVNTLPTNIIWFGDSVSIDDVKSIADAMLRASIQLRAIRRFPDGSGIKSQWIEIGASPQHTTGPILTSAKVRAANDFPRAKITAN